MTNDELIREIATKAFCETLQAKSQELAEDVARRMKAALEPQSAPRERTKALRDGTVLIAGSRTQTETLETLLAASSALTPGCGLLILHGAQAGGWSCHGLTSLDNFKRATMDCSRGIPATVIKSCTPAETRVSELDPIFVARLGLDKLARVVLIPVLLKERVAALLLALAAEGDELEGLEVLVQVAQLALDTQAYRKAATKPAGDVPAQSAPPPPAAEQPQPAAPSPAPVSTPTDAPAVSVPVEPKVETAVEPEKVAPEVVPVPQPAPEPEPVYAAATPAAVAVEAPEPEPVYAAASVSVVPLPPPAPEVHVAVPAVAMIAAPVSHESVPPAQTVARVPDEAHEKARRFAKLLVEEIKLYNQTKVAEGRARGDLYSRLRDDIEKSRAAYQKRYGESVRDVDYFSQELMRILADNNRSVMGAGFPG